MTFVRLLFKNLEMIRTEEDRYSLLVVGLRKPSLVVKFPSPNFNQQPPDIICYVSTRYEKIEGYHIVVMARDG